MRNSFQQGIPFVGIVKKLIIIHVVLWVGLVLILQNLILGNPLIYEWFGYLPGRFFHDFWIWQPFTYMFLHSETVFHVLFNMLLLWWLGAELQVYWGQRYFLFFYLACGIGAALLYGLGVLVYYFVTGNNLPLLQPVVGASGAIFGLMVAYGMIFGERMVYFLMFFPMKAKIFVMIIAGIEILNLLSQGFGSQVSNLCHLGGLATGYILLKVTPKIQEILLRRKTRAHGRRLKLVVDQDDKNGPNSNKGPRYWN